jgi:hypothetical protein
MFFSVFLQFRLTIAATQPSRFAATAGRLRMVDDSENLYPVAP